jgi:hypothetical protein
MDAPNVGEREDETLKVVHVFDGEPADGLNSVHDAVIGIAEVEMEIAHIFGECDGEKVALCAWAERV